MRRFVPILMVVFIGLSAAAARAATKLRTGVVKGTLSSTTGTKCLDTGYANQCLSGTCSCRTFTGATVAGSVGHGTADLDLTIDDGDATSSPGCKPFFGEADVTITSPPLFAGSGGLSLNGSVCNVNGTDLILGGFGIPAPFSGTGATGFGILAGTQNESTGKLVLRIQGLITTP